MTGSTEPGSADAPVCIRPYRPAADLPPVALAELIAAGCREERQYAGECAFLTDLGGRDLQCDLLAGEPGWWVAWQGSAPVGLVRLVTEGEVPGMAAIVGLYVAPRWRRRGVGRRLVTAALHEARACGLQVVRIYVAEKNPARHFYTRLGWRPGQACPLPGYVCLEYPVDQPAGLGNEP